MKATFHHFLRHILGIVHLTKAQWVYVKVAMDRIDPADLSGEERELARKVFGAVERIPAPARHVVAMLKGARVGGTWLWALYLLWRGLTADFSRLAPGEHGFGAIVTERLSLGRQALRYVKGAADAVPAIKALIVAETADSISFRRPQDDRIATIECVAASRGGSAARGKSYFGALLDEASFFRDPDTGVINDMEVFRAIGPRVMAGGILAVVSTAWMTSGLLWDLVQQNHGSPTTALAAICPTLLMRDDDKIKADVAIAKATDPTNAAREFDCVPFAQGAGNEYFGPAVDRCAFDGTFPDFGQATTVYLGVDPKFAQNTPDKFGVNALVYTVGEWSDE